MATKRKVNNLLALAVLAVLAERPMHRYEIATTIRERGKDRDMDVKWGSLYTVVNNLEKAGFLEVVGSERDGARPERTIFTITDAGRAELADWTRDLIAEPEPEHHRFTAGLSVMAGLAPEEVAELLGRRADALDRAIETARRELEEITGSGLSRLFIVESEYDLAMLEAEASWTRALREEITGGTFPDLELWHRAHASGLKPAEAFALFERGPTG
ncbi:PadR family transcriptional regulator [Microlunatus parietis]|uniref:DNA-binding PadR family transcriptional regulator n=1 Tax=Microlunatus parietis TaxID=682979 RepID=A0A7Y9LC54_9ACTN|nr:PadR family transcriptional regulator [Microlunatus parietis]NYE70516.1 DNA-binding PadR family transcriptional regulator [Microlunatus parietis]